MVLNEKLIVNLFEKVLRVENKEVNNDLKLQLLDTYISVQAQIKHDTKAVKYLLRYFTNKVELMIEDRAATYPQAAQAFPIPYLAEIQ